MLNLEYLDLGFCRLEEFDDSLGYCRKLIRLNLEGCVRLKRFPCVKGESLEYLNIQKCYSLEKFPEIRGTKVDDSLGYCGKLITLDMMNWLKRFPCVNVESLESNVESLESLDLRYCSNLEKFPKIRGRMKLELEIKMNYPGIREPLSSLQYLTHITKLDLSSLRDLVALPSSSGMLKSLGILNVFGCSKLESLQEEIGDLENLEKLDAAWTLISRPPSSIVRLNKLKFLSFAKQSSEVGLKDRVCFVFPQVNEGLRSLEELDLNYCNLKDGGLLEDIGRLSSLKKLNLWFCNLKDGGLPEDIGSLSSLNKLYLRGNNFEYFPRSIENWCSSILGLERLREA
ncbi:TMV resistance protein N-like [Lycium ferocissimum]|uniref:TMV resistance protein N-like n=1 Tax=Lycium ferocissimum TaxID=112874 RepID=UPI0028153B6D|nr:TMV resistance protein N-like [Lycium ferocissimum]